MMRPHVAVVILTLGDRPGPLLQAIRSVRAQHDVEAEIVVVWNGGPAGRGEGGRDALEGDDTVRHVRLPENVGIPAGRNAGARASSAPLLFFLDDDAELVDESILASLVELFSRPDLGAVSLRIIDEHGETAQRHVPRWGKGSADRSGEVTSFLGGVTVVRRAAFDEAGGYEGAFFYSLEETDLAWRLVDRGWSIWYAADLRVRHPRTSPARHPGATRRTARNRVWLVHRLLPLPLAVTYLMTWFAISAVRSPRAASSIAAGYWEGWRTRVGPRRPIGWRTVWRLTRTGRPPVV
jgi:GT2 family glycosyltransferase